MGLHRHSDKSLYAREVNARDNAKKIRPGNASYIAGTVCLLTIAIRLLYDYFCHCVGCAYNVETFCKGDCCCAVYCLVGYNLTGCVHNQYIAFCINLDAAFKRAYSCCCADCLNAAAFRQELDRINLYG